MSAALDRSGALQAIHVRPVERRRGELGMWLFIATEAALFALLFFAYFYLATSRPQWPPEEDPPFTLALILLGILLVSSITAHLGQRRIEKAQRGAFILWTGITLTLAAAFIGVQMLEYQRHLRILHPGDNAYGSLFYTITSFHFAHLVLGVLLLVFVLARALAGHFTAERHLAVKNATFYWHFVDAVWILIVAILYLLPQLTGPPP